MREYAPSHIEHLALLGSKGTTGTQASFLELFDGDHEKVNALEEKIAYSPSRIRMISVLSPT